VFSVVGDVSIDSEVPAVTSSISRCAGIVFRRCYRDRICVRVFIGVSVHTCEASAAQTFGSAHRRRVYVRVLTGVSVRAC
jgi:hypothetical protein